MIAVQRCPCRLVASSRDGFKEKLYCAAWHWVKKRCELGDTGSCRVWLGVYALEQAKLVGLVVVGQQLAMISGLACQKSC